MGYFLVDAFMVKVSSYHFLWFPHCYQRGDTMIDIIRHHRTHRCLHSASISCLFHCLVYVKFQPCKRVFKLFTRAHNWKKVLMVTKLLGQGTIAVEHKSNILNRKYCLLQHKYIYGHNINIFRFINTRLFVMYVDQIKGN